jgi:hypothetical protein
MKKKKKGKKKNEKSLVYLQHKMAKALLCATKPLALCCDNTWVGLAHKHRIIYLFIVEFKIHGGEFFFFFLILNFLAYT